MGPSVLSFEITRTLQVPLGTLWAVLGDFGTEHRWTRTLSYCERDSADVAVGTSRTCILPRPLLGRTEVREELTEFEPGVALAYKLDGAAGPFVEASSRWSTRALSPTTTVLTVGGRFTPRSWLARVVLWPLVRPMIRRLTRNVMLELEAFVAGGSHVLPAPVERVDSEGLLARGRPGRIPSEPGSRSRGPR